MPLHITYPLIRAFNVQENAVFIHEFSKKNLPTVTPLQHPPPSLKNPGYVSAGKNAPQGVEKMHCECRIDTEYNN